MGVELRLVPLVSYTTLRIACLDSEERDFVALGRGSSLSKRIAAATAAVTGGLAGIPLRAGFFVFLTTTVAQSCPSIWCLQTIMLGCRYQFLDFV